MNICYIFKYKV